MIAAFALSVVAAVPALAAKDLKHFYKVFANCPAANPAVQGCTAAKSGAGSFFQAGKVTVQLSHPITLTGGFTEDPQTGIQLFVGPEYGNAAVKPVAQPGPDLTEGVDAELLPPAEKKRYEKAVAAGRTKVTATVELAGPPSSITLNEENLLAETGVFLGLPVQVKLTNPFLGKTCYVGSNSSPINIAFTSGSTSPPLPNEPIKGSLGKLSSVAEARILIISENEIVNNDYAAPGVTGCGVGGAADAAINAALGLPSPAGTNSSIIKGTLEQTGANAFREVYLGE